MLSTEQKNLLDEAAALNAEREQYEQELQESYSDQLAGKIDELLFELEKINDQLDQLNDSMRFTTCYCDSCTQS